jgi:hypothetical protein
MNRQKTPLIITLCLLFSTCGIEENFFYLPQVPESGIGRTLNTDAVISIPPLNQDYATGYIIFYKIYISDTNDNEIISILNNNTRILSDYNELFPYTDPSDTTKITSLNTFSSMRYYELELDDGTNIRNTVLSKSGGTFDIKFPSASGDKPFINFNGNKYILYRSNGGGTFNPKPDRYFFSSPELNDSGNAVPSINADVSGQSGISEYAYVSMYIAAVGMNPENFSRLYSKPTHISIFILPKN